MRINLDNSLSLLSLAVISAPLVVYFSIFDKLPESIPAHFNSAGIVDRWMNKSSFEVFLLCALGLIGLLFMKVITKIVLKSSNSNKQYVEPLMRINEFVITMFFSCMSIYFLVNYIGNQSLRTSFIYRMAVIAISLVLVFVGNYLPKLIPNKVSGVRTKAILSSPDIWYKSHRLSGKLFVFACLANLTICINPYFSDPSAILLSSSILILVITTPIIYSFVLKRQNT